MLSLLDLAAILLTLSALFGWLNHKFLPLPHRYMADYEEKRGRR